MFTWFKAAWETCKKVFFWIKANSSILLLSAGLLSISLIIFFCQRRQLRQLQIELALLKTQMKLQKLAFEKDVQIQNIAVLKEKDKELREKLAAIEEDLKKELPDDMTEEEILKNFKELGLLKRN